jgi:hypothetical protein
VLCLAGAALALRSTSRPFAFVSGPD